MRSKGGLTGTDGIHQAAEHIIAELEAIGAEPLPGSDGYRLPFQYTGRASDGGTSLGIDTDAGPRWDDTESVRALSFSESGEVTGPLIFAGYGLVVPETDGFSYDSYATIDVTDKIVVVLRYFPEDAETDLRAAFSRYASLRFKAQAARQRGAIGLIVVTGPRSPNAGALVAMTGDHRRRRLRYRGGEHRRRARRFVVQPGGGQDAGGGAARARLRESARRRVRDSGRRDA